MEIKIAMELAQVIRLCKTDQELNDCIRAMKAELLKRKQERASEAYRAREMRAQS
jgi:hypothetical protein